MLFRSQSVWADGYAYGIDDVDWYDVVYKNTAFAMEHNASISGGNKKFNYYTSLNYLDNNGFMKLNSDKYNRYNGTAKINAEITPWARMSYNMRWTRTDYQRPRRLDQQSLQRHGTSRLADTASVRPQWLLL